MAPKVGVLWDRNIYCLEARPCRFQPGNFTGWSSGGVKLSAALETSQDVLDEGFPIFQSDVMGRPARIACLYRCKSAGGRLQLNTHAPYVCGLA